MTHPHDMPPSYDLPEKFLDTMFIDVEFLWPAVSDVRRPEDRLEWFWECDNAGLWSTWSAPHGVTWVHPTLQSFLDRIESDPGGEAERLSEMASVAEWKEARETYGENIHPEIVEEIARDVHATAADIERVCRELPDAFREARHAWAKAEEFRRAIETIPRFSLSRRAAIERIAELANGYDVDAGSAGHLAGIARRSVLLEEGNGSWRLMLCLALADMIAIEDMKSAPSPDGCLEILQEIEMGDDMVISWRIDEPGIGTLLDEVLALRGKVAGEILSEAGSAAMTEVVLEIHRTSSASDRLLAYVRYSDQLSEKCPNEAHGLLAHDLGELLAGGASRHALLEAYKVLMAKYEGRIEMRRLLPDICITSFRRGLTWAVERQQAFTR